MLTSLPAGGGNFRNRNHIPGNLQDLRVRDDCTQEDVRNVHVGGASGTALDVLLRQPVHHHRCVPRNCQHVQGTLFKNIVWYPVVWRNIGRRTQELLAVSLSPSSKYC